jgi:hypothetical protein
MEDLRENINECEYVYLNVPFHFAHKKFISGNHVTQERTIMTKINFFVLVN